MNYDEDWVDARTRDLLADLEQSYGRRFDWDRAGDLVRAFVVYRDADADEPWSKEDREALASGGAMALLGKEYRPPSPTSRYGAPVNVAVAFNAAVGLGIAALDWQRHHTEVPDAEGLREILTSLMEWLYPISDTCTDLADAAKAAAHPEGDDADVVVIEARHAFRSAEMLARTAEHLERDYLAQSEQADWTSSAAVCAGLSTSVDELRRATGAA